MNERIGAFTLRRARAARVYEKTVRGLVALLVAALLLGPLAFSSTAAGRCGIKNRGGWESIPAPRFPSGPRTIVSFAVPATEPDLFLVTNGVSVMRSNDGGCKWTETFSLDSLPSAGFTFSSADSTITKVVFNRGVEQYAYLLIRQGVGPASRAHVVMSATSGTEWEPGDQGLTAAGGDTMSLSASLVAPQAVYLVANDTASSQLYVSQTYGRSWDLVRAKVGGIEVQGVPPVPTVDLEDSGTQLERVEVTPLNPADLWLSGPRGLYHSDDAGVTLKKVKGIPKDTQIGAMRIISPGQNPTNVLAFEAGQSKMYHSVDGGGSFPSYSSPGLIQSAAGNPTDVLTVVSTGPRVYLLNAAVNGAPTIVDLSPTDGHEVLNVLTGMTSFTQQGEVALPILGHTDSTIERKLWVQGFAAPPANLPSVGELNNIDIDLGAAGLYPPSRRIVLEKGETKTVDYDVQLPGSPNPLDVYFLIDVSGSMQDAINGTASAMYDIVSSLTAAGIDAHFGVGEYRSYDDDPSLHKVADVQAPGDGIEQALESLRADGGGQETQLGALMETAEGDGQYPVDVLHVAPLIPPDQDASWRWDSTRVIIMVTDEPFSTGAPHPTWEQTAQALILDNAVQVGLAIQETNSNSSFTPRYGLERVARDTGSLAPDGGVDCDSDGDIDIAVGDELVCTINPRRASEAGLMAPAIVNLLAGVLKPADVSLRTTGADIVRHVVPEVRPSVEFDAEKRLDFDITYSCPPLKQAKRFEADVTVEVGGIPYHLPNGQTLTSNTELICKVPARPKPRDPLVTPLIFIPPVLPPLAARPPDIAPNPNPNPQPQSQAQAQGALAHQKQEQPQLAFAHSQNERITQAAAEEYRAEKKGYEMTAYTNEEDAVPVSMLWIGATMMTFAFGVASMRERVRIRTQQARVRRW